MPAYFVDTWFFVARSDRSDSHYARAKRLHAALRQSTLVTHSAVLIEVLAYFSGYGAHGRALAVGTARTVDREMTLVHVDQSLFMRAVDLYAARPDKEYSLVDCVSMIVMRQRGIRHVLTNDHHFRQEGFIVVSE